MKYIVAVSGGVDSVVLLDMLVGLNEHEIIVAHFDHGIREDSSRDAAFVGELAKRYGLQFETAREELGANASEAVARTRRYKFLREVAQRHDAQIVTAHHQDDVIETIAINLTRGTGWRGLAVLGDTTIVRPLITSSKQDLYDYALRRALEWVEDETNSTDSYLRNRIRRRLAHVSDETKHQLIELWMSQRELAAEIDAECSRLKTHSRYFMTMIDEASASELLRAVLADYSLLLTRPQRRQLLHAVKTALPGSKFEAGSRSVIEFTPREFIVKHPL